MRDWIARFEALPRPLRIVLGFGVPALLGCLALALRHEPSHLNAIGIWGALSVALVAGLYPLSQGKRLRIFAAASIGHLLIWGLCWGLCEHDVIYVHAAFNSIAFAKLAACAAAPLMLGLAWDLDVVGSEEWPASQAGWLLGLGLTPLLAGIMPQAYLAQVLAPVLALSLAGACLTQPGWSLGLDTRALLRGLAWLNCIALLQVWHGHRLPESWTWFFPCLRWLALAWSMAPASRRFKRGLLAATLALALNFAAKSLGGDFPRLASQLTPAALSLGWALLSPALPNLAVVLGLVLLAPAFLWSSTLLARLLALDLLRECLFLPLALSLSALPKVLTTYRWKRA
jgi:hypothetical protein